MTTGAKLDGLLLRVGGGLLMAGVAAVLLLGALAADSTGAALDGGISCIFLSVTGVPCPLCGMTHATLAAGAGDLAGAFAAHPLFPVVLLFAVWGGYCLAAGRRLAVAGRSVTVSHVLAGTAVVWAANLVAHYA